MFARLRHDIGLLPPWGRPLAWIAYAILRIMWCVLVFCARILQWILGEMGRQASAQTKKMLAPLLWPIAGLLSLGLVYVLLGQEVFEQTVLPLVLTIGIMLFGLRVMLSPIWPMGKKKKK